ncbi:non-ribosomal peptide synthetase [Gordonia bronchialis]|uniref:non-ribosomal peptide synthetase n=1 Tax=Gordonia bronchialis TaxID=2054 RepID=UPI00226E836F|nr:non-ribosomal peptide synthetase [Gordonia bronchialis]
MTADSTLDQLQDTDRSIPLTAAQRGIYYAQQIDPDVPMSVVAYAEFRDDVDADTMRRAVLATSTETESGLLRLVADGDDEPRVIVDHDRAIELGLRDFSDADDPRSAAVAWMDHHRSKATDLFDDPLLETYLLRLGPRHVIWYCWGHHLAFDGYAAMYMMVRVAAHYTAISAGTDAGEAHTATMSEIADLDHRYRSSDHFTDDHDYWMRRLTDDGTPENTSLSTRAEPAAPITTVRSADLDDALVQSIRDIAAEHGIRPASVITAAVAAYLARLNDRCESMLSLPVAARDRDILRTSAGLTSNVVPIRVRIDESTTSVAQLMCDTNAEIKQAVRHQKYRHEDITAEILDSPGGRRGFFGPMVNVMLFFEHIDFGSLRGELNVLSTGPVEDASINVYDGFTGGMRLDLEANPNVYAPWEIDTHHERIIDFLTRFVQADPQRPVVDLELLTADETAALPARSAGTVVATGEVTLVDMLDEAAWAFADETAIIDAGSTAKLTHADLAARADTAAAALAARGIGPESVVGVQLARSTDQVIALHAVIRAGAAFLPLDPAEPAERLGHILGTAQPSLIIADEPSHGTVTLAGLLDESATVIPHAPHPDHAAYVLFTSGSTGKPKGVVITHRAIVNRLRWMQARYRLTTADRVLQKTPATFDVSVWEFFWPFVTGAGLVVPTPDGHRDPWYLRDVIDRFGVTTTHFVPSMLTAFAAALTSDAIDAHSTDSDTTAAPLSSLRQIFTSGEALTPATVGATALLTSAPVHNLYGPTEAAIDVTYHDHCSAAGAVVPIGRPVWNTSVRVLDHRLTPQPDGAVGELYLGGIQLARGYRSRPDLTAARFVADPAGSGERLYRTGDLVRRRADGELEYLGRTDSQVKIRGQRVELGEIEAALSRLPGVRAAGVVLRDDVVSDSNAVVGYVAGASLDERDLRSELADQLPDHMVPTVVTVLDELPTTSNGKLDRRALPAPPRPDTATMVAPADALERLVADTVTAVLGIPQISMSANFFESGGNSLSATRVAARLSRATGHKVGIRAVFDSADLTGLAAGLRTMGVDAGPGTPATGTAALPASTGPVRLSPAQHRLWLSARLDPGAAATYNIPFTVRLVGGLDTDALRNALADVVLRHEPLHSLVEERDGTPYIAPLDPQAVHIELPVGDTDGNQSDRDFASLPFDLATDLPIRARLIRTGPDDHRLTIVIHHIAADGWSLAPLALDLATAYRARRDGVTPDWSPLPVTYSQVSAARHAHTTTESVSLDDAELQYWGQVLADAPAETELPLDRPRTRTADAAGATMHTTLSAQTHQAVRAIAAEYDVTVFMVLHAAVASLLRTMSQSSDIVVGTPVSGRGDADVDGLVGMFVNTLALRTAVDKDAGFTELLKQVRDTDLGAFEHADVPFDRIVERLNPERSATLHPFFQVSVALEDNSAIELDFAGLTATAARIDTGHTKFDLQFTFAESISGGDTDGGGLSGIGLEINYATALFDPDTVRGLASRLGRTIDAVTADPHRAVGDIPMLDLHERLDLVPAVGAGRRPVEHLSRLLCSAVDSEPHRAAICDGDTVLTYRELDTAANRLARLLIDHGAGPETFVAVALPRGVDWMVTLWAIARTGAAWVPIDPDYPVTRITHMLTDSGARLLITDGPSDPGAELSTIRLDDADVIATRAAKSGGRITDAELHSPREVDHPAYLIYTSGTTGTPKGVVVGHRGIADFAAQQVTDFGITPDSHTMHMASPSFDASILEVLMAVAAAATMHIVPPGVVGGVELAELMRARRITHAFLTPSVLTTMTPDEVPDLQALVIGGEHPNPAVVRQWSAGPALFNAYGPTETTVVATVSSAISPDYSTLTIGRPIRGIAAMVLDERLRPVMPGAVGELYIAGDHLARGYHGVRPLTSKHFIANPYGHPGERMYRTGDLARWTADHELEFRGRADHQTKIRGHRIELGEIDAALADDDAVLAAVTTTHGSGSQAHLVSYVTTVGAGVSTQEIRGRLIDRLPRHMIPSAIIELDEIPKTPIGKVDLRALPEPDSLATLGGEIAYVSPRSDTERRVAAVIAERLGLDAGTVGRDHDFFDLGGNSLLATQIVGALEHVAGRRITVREVFEHSTVAQLARLADGGVGPEGTDDPRPLADLYHDPDAEVLPGPAQRQLWFLNQLDGRAENSDPHNAAYAIAFALDLRGELDVDALTGALRHAIARHEPLRTVFDEADGQPTMRIRSADEVGLDLTPTDADDTGWAQEAHRLATLPFDLTCEVPLRVRLHRIDGDPTHHKLTIVVHHIAADGWSMAPLGRDIAGAYADLKAGRSPAQDALPVGYRDYLRWQAENLGLTGDGSRMADLTGWWRRELGGLDVTPTLVADVSGHEDTNRAAGVVEVDFDADLRRRLLALADGKATEFMTVHAVFAALLHRLHGDADVHLAGEASDIVIGTPVAGRNDPRLSDLVGMFVNSVVLRTPVDGGAGFSALLDEVRHRDLEALSQADIPFAEIVAMLNPPRTQSHPVFQIALAFDAAVSDTASVAPDIAIDGLDVRTQEIDTGAARFDLELRIRGDVARFTYATDVFSHTRISGLADTFVRLANSIVDDPDTPIDQLPVLAADTNTGPVAFTPPAHLADILEGTVRAHPDTIAVDDGTATMTYAELDAVADEWASRLHALGIGTDDAVAVALDRSIESIVAVWAITKAGAAAVPIDTRYPADRVEHMIADSGALLGITSSDRFDRVPRGIWWLSTESLSSVGHNDSGHRDPALARHTDSLAYVVYTSGSTGKPKGVSVSHRGLAAFAVAQQKRYEVSPGDRTLHFASPAFDATMLEFLLAFSAGATMVIAPSTIYGGDELVDFMAEQAVTHAFITPAALAAATPRDLPYLRTLGVGGEASSPELVARWAPGRRYVNCYGPTETTIVATMSEPLQPGDNITIGAPIEGCTALVLDRHLQPVPDHVPGDLYLSGPGVARGYLNRRGLSATRFVATPTSHVSSTPGGVMYRTGDIVRRRTDGALIYQGRTDNQVKVRGFRIELDEVSAVLSAVPGVDFATTIVRGRGADATLVGYVTLDDVTPDGGPRPDAEHILTTARRTLPRHMVPAAVVILDSIPLTGNGKLDHRALPDPAPQRDHTVGRAPRSRTEAVLIALLADVLGITGDAIGADDDFFELGGTSLQATTVVSRLNRHHIGDRIRVRDLFEHPTAEALAELVSLPADIDPDATAQPVVVRRERPDEVPLAPVQRRLWSMAAAAPDSTEYAMPFALRLHGRLDHDALRAALRDLVARHTSLRTVYPMRDGTPIARVLDDPAAVIGDLSVRETYDPRAAMARTVARPFDLAADAGLRASLWRDISDRGVADEHLLLLVVHHIAADGASLPILVGDLIEAYRSRRAGRSEDWSAADVDYRDYALDMADDTAAPEDLEFWTDLLADAPAETTVAPRHGSATATGAGTAGSVSMRIDADLRAGLHHLARTHSTTPFSVLHTALAVLLHRIGSGRDVVIGTPVANRAAPTGSPREYDGVIGMFVNTLALRTAVAPTQAVADLLAATRDADLAALDHRATPFDDVVTALNPERESGRHPLFQIALSVHDHASGIDGNSIPMDDDLWLSAAEIDSTTAKFDLQFTVTGIHDEAAKPAVSLTYDTDRYRHEDAELLITRLLRVVRAMLRDPGSAVGDVRITDPLEVAALAPATGPEPGSPMTLGALLDAAVRRNPDGVAAITDTGSITYAELDARSNRLARVLLGRGVAERDAGAPEPVVAMAIGRSIEALVAIWAIVKSGAAYVPVDPTYPADRIAHMLSDSSARLVVTTTADAERLPTGLPMLVIDDRAVRTRIGHSSPALITDAERPATVHTDQLAYVIYTSGSTGTPKGVLVPHAGLRAVHDELRERLTPGTTSRVLHFASPSFDASVLEFLLAACGSATLVIAPTDVYGGTALSDFIDRHGVTHAFITPAAVASMDPARVPSLRALAVGGEDYGPELVRRWAPGRTLVNVYGPTETTIITTGSQPLTARTELTIGTPNNGVGAIVLDERLHPVPAGVVGELYLIGAQVTRGYHRRPGLTSVRFLPAPMVTGPHHAGSRMYRTGDLVRWTDDGRIVYVGRSDTQVQMRGFRIELGEIDDALAAHPSVDFAVTVVDDSGSAATLRSYVTAAQTDSSTPEPAALRRHLSRSLPRHMVPSSVTVLDEIPLTPVGKLDRAALPAPSADPGGRPPAPGTETAVAQVFAEVLGVDAGTIGADDGFFDLGGNSLMATSATTRLNETLGCDIRAQILFTAPSPAELAALLAEDATEQSDALGPVLTLRRHTPGGRAPLFVVHPAIGLSWSFTSLLPHLPADRGVYGLQNPMLSGGDAPTSIAELAAFYLDRIREISPDGPYHLLGWSLGGLIAQEMAVQLAEAGEQVGDLILLDSFVIADRPGFDAEPSMVELMSEFGLAPAESDAEPTLHEVWQAIAEAGGILGGVTEEAFGAVHRTFRAATALAADWRPRTYDGDATFVSATVDPPAGAPAADDWRTAVAGRLTRVEVDCTHARMLLPENVTGFIHSIR